MTCILEVNDADLTLYRGHAVLHRSPAVAVVLNDDVHFGEDALRLSRIHPRNANQHYFTRLNGDPLPVPGSRARNHADLVYLHLKTFQPLIEAEGGDVLVAVPGVLSPDQLGVLLGVLQQVGVRVVGFVDAAVAALSTRQVPPRAFHLDLLLQRAVVTGIEAGETVAKTGAQEVPECGLNRLTEAWIDAIADRFVRETRFDPLHAAASEQQLFNQIHDWLERGADGPDLVVEIDHAEHTRRVEISRALLEEKAQQRLRQIADAVPPGADVFVGARSARLPGLHRTLEALQARVTVLPGDALTRGCLEHLDRIVPRDGELRLVTRLPHGGSRAERPATVEAAPEAATEAATEAAAHTVPETTSATADAATLPAPTHALHNHEAWALDDGVPLPITRSGTTLLLTPRPGLRLNGEALAEPAALAPGDRVAMGEREYLMIRVRG